MAPQASDEQKAIQFLRRHGYSSVSPAEAVPSSELAGAVAEYQKRHRLTVSGELDPPTRDHLSQSRCGWVDEPPERLQVQVMAETPFAASGALSLPWFLGPVPNFGIPPAQVIAGIEQAFAAWQDVTPVLFPRQASPATARLIVSWGPIDGRMGVLARTLAGASTQYDQGEGWSLTDPPAPDANADILTIALHEIGHAIGIGDIPSDPSAIMHGFFGNGAAVVRRQFTATDLQAIAERFDG
jgi:hypothetical protein